MRYRKRLVIIGGGPDVFLARGIISPGTSEGARPRYQITINLTLDLDACRFRHPGLSALGRRDTGSANQGDRSPRALFPADRRARADAARVFLDALHHTRRRREIARILGGPRRGRPTALPHLAARKRSPPQFSARVSLRRPPLGWSSTGTGRSSATSAALAPYRTPTRATGNCSSSIVAHRPSPVLSSLVPDGSRQSSRNNTTKGDPDNQEQRQWRGFRRAGACYETVEQSPGRTRTQPAQHHGPAVEAAGGKRTGCDRARSAGVGRGRGPRAHFPFTIASDSSTNVPWALLQATRKPSITFAADSLAMSAASSSSSTMLGSPTFRSGPSSALHFSCRAKLSQTSSTIRPKTGTAKRLTLLLQNEFEGVRAGYRPVAATLALLYEALARAPRRSLEFSCLEGGRSPGGSLTVVATTCALQRTARLQALLSK